MASIVLRSRIMTTLSKFGSRNRRMISSEASSSNSSGRVQGLSSDQSMLSDFPPPNQPIPPPPPQAEVAAALGKERKGLKYLSYGLLWAFTGVTAATGYASYAYTLDEVNEKTKAFRESAKQLAEQARSANSSGIDKYQTMLYSTAMTGSAKAIDKYLELRELVEEHVKGFTEPLSEKLLPDVHPAEQHVFTLVLDLNETLLYTDWKRERGWRTFKRPGVDAFLEHLARYYEIVLYSDQMDMYVDPVLEKLDPNHCYIRYKLTRSATKYENGKHYRDLSKLNRDPKKILYVSGNAFESSLQPENCVPIKPYKLEADDTALVDLIPFLEYVARSSPADIRPVLASFERKDVAKEFLDRSIEYQKKKMQEQRGQGRFWRR